MVRHDSSNARLNCTNLAVYSVTNPEVVGRPRYSISEEVLLHLRSTDCWFHVDENSSNTSCFTVDIWTSYCGVWVRGDHRLLDDFG